MTKIKDKLVDTAWHIASIGLGLAIQAPTEVIKYTSDPLVKINGKDRPDLPWDMKTGVLEAILTQKPVIAQLSRPKTRRIIVFM